MDNKQIQSLLNANGFPCGPVDGVVGHDTRVATAHFQFAYCNHRGPLDVDGIPGPLTQAALTDLPYLSPHFTVNELKSHGDGTCYVRRELLLALEKLRAAMNRPLPLIDAYRDPAYNAHLKGAATDSMHIFGLAADIDTKLGLTVSFVQSLHLFAGIGDQNGIVRHVDCRQNAGTNNHTPWATVNSPARWHY